ncbi:MAG: molybdopterin-dependent oxidoreductase, partial [Verrucomicrobiota bacterium]
DSNYSLNTVDICPVGALTSKDFRFSMRVWFLRETKSLDVNCGTGTNILIGSRENVLHRITPRENDFVNSCWMPDNHRLNFHYVNSAERLTEPAVQGEESPVKWPRAIQAAADQLRKNPGATALIASARMTNEELFLTKRLVATLGIALFDVLPRPQKGDGFLIAEDGNPNTSGAKLLGLATGQLAEIAAGVSTGKIKTLLVLGEDATDCGIPEADLAKLDALVVTGILSDKTTANATALLPAASWVEKRGTMINVKGRIQRLNRAIASPGLARDDWEILRDLIQATGGSNGIFTIEEVFKQLAAEVPALAGLSLGKIGDLGVQLSL